MMFSCTCQLILIYIVLAENEHENKVQTPDRLQSLHTRLHQEAEKIRKWKTSTELDLKEKVSHQHNITEEKMLY